MKSRSSLCSSQTRTRTLSSLFWRLSEQTGDIFVIFQSSNQGLHLLRHQSYSGPQSCFEFGIETLLLFPTYKILIKDFKGAKSGLHSDDFLLLISSSQSCIRIEFDVLRRD